MNVLVADQFGAIGGAQKCLLDLLARWDDSGTVHAAAPEGALAQAIRDLGFPTLAIPCGPYTLGRKSAADAIRFAADTFRQYRILRRAIEQHSIDVVYVNGPRILAGASLAADGRCRLIFHAHNCLSHWHDRAIVQRALRRGAKAIACCRFVARSIGARSVVHNGVPDAGFRLRQYPPAGAWRIGIVGRISPEKGHLVLFDAARRLALEGHDIAVIVAGASQFGSGEYESQVRRASAGLNVRFTGWRDDVGSVLAECDLLALPSTAEPGLPRVLLEAFSSGVPVVASPTGGIPEAIRDNETGFLATGATAPEFAARLRSAIEARPSDLLRVAMRARAEWESYWNVDRWRREVLTLIRSQQAVPAQALDERRPESGCVAPQSRA